MLVRALSLCLVLTLSGCGKDDGDTATDAATGTGTTADTTDTPTTGATAATTDTPTTGATADTTDTSTTGATAGTTDDTSTSTGPGTASTTGVDVSGFERFLLSSAAGPCPPNVDCDGFVELLASGTLRVEVFGDVTEMVTEVEISADDFAAAVQVFADPALVALLDGDDPVCNPPTDVFESMLVEIDGVTHDASTTACGQPPLVAAREMANDLRTQYVP